MTLTSSSSPLTIPDMLNSFDQWGGFLFTNDATSETISNIHQEEFLLLLLKHFVVFFGERERGRSGWGGMKKADLNKLVKAGHLTYFFFLLLFFLLYFAIGPSSNCSVFWTFFFPFYFLTGGD